MDCEGGSERNRAVQKVDVQVNLCSSDGETDEAELKQRCMEVVMVLINLAVMWGRSLLLKLTALAGFLLGR